MWKLFKMLMGISLLPTCCGLSTAVYKLQQNSIATGAESGAVFWALPSGFLLWVLIYFLLPRPFRTYVLGHELTHALWALLMGARIGRMKVSNKGGHVELSKTNFVITLAPYFFPFYTFLVIAAYYLANVWFPMEPYRAWWLGAVGFTWAFHVTFTIQMLLQHQPDVHEHGRIFSFTVIYLMNLLLIGIWIVLIGEPTFSDLGQRLSEELSYFYISTYELLQPAYAYVEDFIRQSLAEPAK